MKTTTDPLRGGDAVAPSEFTAVPTSPRRRDRHVVMKFGGTSLADPQRMQRAARRVAATVRAGRSAAVVVSAMGRTTDELVALAGRMAQRRPQRELDLLLSTGECVSAALMTMALADLNCPAVALTGGQAGLLTDSAFGSARVRAVDPRRVSDVLDQEHVAVITGFQGVSPDQDITTLGRGGSDASAVLIAAMLGVEVCEIFTDVDGVFTADPRVHADAALLPHLSYERMLMMARTGAQVMQDRAVEIAQATGVVLHVRSSFHDRPGTLVGDAAVVQRLGTTGVPAASDPAPASA